jgi:hypothetical protein
MGILDTPGLSNAKVLDLLDEQFTRMPDAGYDIWLVTGQSNGQGAAIDFTSGVAPDTVPRLVFQYGATASVPRAGAGQITAASDPLIHRWTQSGPPTMGPGIPFAREYAASMALGRRLLLVPAAYSGTGFSSTNHGTENSTHWRPGDSTGINLYESAITQALAAKTAAGKNARFAGIIWVQGETDEAMDPVTYRNYLDSLIAGFRTRLGEPNLPFLIGGMVPEGLTGNAGRTAIAAVHADTPTRVARTAYVAGPSGHFIDSGLHYDAAGQRIQGYNLFHTALPAALANAPVAPAQVTGLTAGTPGSSSVPMSWSAAARADSYTIEYKASTDTVWITGPTVTTTSTSLTGIGGATTYNIRVYAHNLGGNGAPSATVNATTIAAGSLLGDLSAPAYSAYGFRKLHSSYSGPAIRVRRLSDSVEQDIALSGNDLNTAALLSFIGTGSGYIVTYYDLTGNGRHLTQPTAAAQHRIVNGGVMDAQNGKPIGIGNGNSYYSGAFAGLYAAGAASVLAVTRGVATANGRLFAEGSSLTINQQYAPLMSNATTAANLSQRITDNSGGSVLADTATTAAFSASAVQMTAQDSGSSFRKRVNGVDAGTIAYTRTGIVTLDTTGLGALVRTGTAGAIIGVAFAELISFNSDIAPSDRTAVEASQKAYFATP